MSQIVHSHVILDQETNKLVAKCYVAPTTIVGALSALRAESAGRVALRIITNVCGQFGELFHEL